MKSTINGVTTYFVGNHYELTGTTVTKYYFAGTSRIAMRKYTVPVSMTVEYLLGDHLGSTSITTNTAGAKVSEMRYKPFGELRYSWTNATVTTPSYTLSKYSFTGQYSYAADFGLLYYNARWYDPALGRFAQADSIVPAGVQGYDRYAYVNNSPLNYVDPSGHNPCQGAESGYKCNRELAKAQAEWRQTQSEANCRLLCLEYNLSPEAAGQLIKDIDVLLGFSKKFNIGSSLAEITGLLNTMFQAAGFKGAEFLGVKFISLALGVSLSEAAVISGAVAASLAIQVTAPSMITTNDLQDLRDGLADADADTLGATITDDDWVVYHQITVASTKNGGFSKTFDVLMVSPAISYVPAYLIVWSEVLHPEYFSHGGR